MLKSPVLRFCYSEMMSDEKKFPHASDQGNFRLLVVVARDPVEREKISKKVKDLYDKRSAVTHGRGTSVSDADVLEMQDMATSVIAVLCHHADDYSLLRDFWRAISLARRSGQIFK